MSNLRLINETSITSSVSSLNVEDVFSTDFDVYQIIATNITTTGTDYTEVDMRLISESGMKITTGQYDYGALQMLTWTSFSDLYAASQNKFRRTFAESTDQSPEGASAMVWVFNPANPNMHTQIINANSNQYGGTYHSTMKGFGVYKGTGACTGFNVYENNGSRPLASGTFRTYGLRIDT